MAGYRQITVTIPFEEMGDGCFVTIRNPLLEPFDREAVVVPRKEDGTLDELALFDRSVNKFAKLVVDWMIYDLEGNVLPLPSADASVAQRTPAHVFNKLRDEAQKLENPTPPGKGSTDGTEKTTT